MWKRSSTSCTLQRCLLKNTYLLLLRGGIGDVFIAAIAVAHIFGFAIVPAPVPVGNLPLLQFDRQCFAQMELIRGMGKH